MCCKKKVKTGTQRPTGTAGTGHKPGRSNERNKATARKQKDDDLIVALWNYTPGGDDELQLKKGDELLLRNHKENNDKWICVRNVADDRQGFVPKEWVAEKTEFRFHEWYYTAGYLKSDIEQLLLGKHLKAGAFAIRPRDNTESEFFLMVRMLESLQSRDNVHKFRIRRKDEKFYLDETMHSSLKSLVEKYKKTPIPETSICLNTPPARPPPRRKELSRQMEDNFQLDRDNLEFGEMLGKGNYGVVYKGKYKAKKGQPIDVAIKEMKGSGIQAETFLSEAKIMKFLDHPNLVNLFGVCTDRDPLLLVTEFMTEGSLDSYLKKRQKKGEPCSERELMDILCQVARGMSYLARNKLVHRDLAARNILVTTGKDGGRQVRVADFGLARITDPGGEAYRATTAVQLAVKWMAPEAYNLSVYTPASDVWSFGVLMFEVLTHGKKPFPGKDGRKIQKKYETGWRMEQDPMISDEMYCKMKEECWDKDPKERPTFKDLAAYFEMMKGDQSDRTKEEEHSDS